jgi:hypothetical protein
MCESSYLLFTRKLLFSEFLTCQMSIGFSPNPLPEKTKASLRLIAQADRASVQAKTYHQRGETNYDTRHASIQV